MQIINRTSDLIDFCNKAKKTDYIAIDTEFLREKTYFAKLCLIQIAFRGDGETDNAIIDVLSKNICLDPIYELFKNKKITKVFHAARQDIEIFFLSKGVIPEPFFDTQTAAGFLGLDKNISYANIVKKIIRKKIDKSHQNTNWLKRPITKSK